MLRAEASKFIRFKGNAASSWNPGLRNLGSWGP